MAFEEDVTELVKACKKKNKKAQHALYERYAPKMLGVCLRYTKDRNQAEDILQEGFIKVFLSIETYTFIGSFEGWLRKIIINTALNHIRDNTKYLNYKELSVNMIEIQDTKVDYDSFSVEAMLAALQSLPEGYRAIFNLYEIEGYSHQEIGEIMEISISTSKSQLSKAKQYLKNKLLNKEDFI